MTIVWPPSERKFDLEPALELFAALITYSITVDRMAAALKALEAYCGGMWTVNASVEGMREAALEFIQDNEIDVDALELTSKTKAVIIYVQETMD